MLGYGTATGRPIPDTDVDRSSVDDAALRAIAGQLHVPFVARSDSSPLDEVLPDGGADHRPLTSVPTAGPRTETYWLPALGAAALILIELYLTLRDVRRSRLAGVKVVP